MCKYLKTGGESNIVLSAPDVEPNPSRTTTLSSRHNPFFMIFLTDIVPETSVDVTRLFDNVGKLHCLHEEENIGLGFGLGVEEDKQ